MGDVSLSRASSFTSAVPSGPPRTASAPSEIAPAPSQPQPLNLEAQQLVRQAAEPNAAPTVATDEDIKAITTEISSLTSALPSVESEFTTAANTLQDSPVSKDGIRNAIAMLGESPQATALKDRLQAAGDDPVALRTLRNDTVDALRSTGRETSVRRENTLTSVSRQMTSERMPADDRWLIRKALIGGMDRSSSAVAQRDRLNASAASHSTQSAQFTQLANNLQDSAVSKVSIRGAITALADHPQAAALKDRLQAAGDDPVALRALRNDVVDALRGESTRLTGLSQAETQGAQHINALNGEGCEEIVANLSMATSLVSSSNSIVKLAKHATNGFVSGAGAAAMGATFGGLQIVTEAVALKRNVGRLTEAMSRRDQAQLVLMPASERGNAIRDMESQIQSLRQPKWYTTKSGREADIAKLEAKIAALKSMGNTESTPQAKAIAQQVVDTTSTTFKALRVLKNIAGIAAGAIAIAVAVGALATPVGWAAAGVVLAATAGLWIYNKVQSSAKEGKIEALMQNRTQIATQIATLEASPSARNPDSDAGKALTRLRELQEKTMVQLLTVSPKHAAAEIIKGLKAAPPDPQMQVLATQVLNVPTNMTRAPFSAQQENELEEFLMRGMPMQPKL